MSENQIIPSCVGRLDPVTDAIRWNRYDNVESLLEDEIKRLAHKLQIIDQERDREGLRLSEVKVFLQMYRLSGDFRIECERACCGQTAN